MFIQFCHANKHHPLATAPPPSPQPNSRQTEDSAPAPGPTAHVEASVWSGTELGTPVRDGVPTGSAALDEQLPGCE